MADGDLTCSKVPAGFIVSREGKYGSTTFFLLKNREELNHVIESLQNILEKDLSDVTVE